MASVTIKERGRPLGSPFSTWLHFRAIPFLGAYLLKLWMGTLRVRMEGFEAVQDLVDRDERFVLAFWHRRLVMMPLAYPFIRRSAAGEDRGVAILASDSRDGERSTATWAYFRIHAVRGTASDDGAKALVRMIRAVKDGWDFGITPDGPRGPRQQLKPGVIALARKTGAWVVPVCVAADRAITLKTWDRMVLPLPFATVTVRYGQPTRHAPKGDDEAEGARLEAAMNALETWA
ncbi:MAG TPA: lysophospholipid acyltransferase family protein, partial [Holophagaceae bacterium]|nr:lysophospholipid acyltransferase family protein [Holophagaceae bacterium]